MLVALAIQKLLGVMKLRRGESVVDCDAKRWT